MARLRRQGVWGAMAAWVDGQGRQWVIVLFYGPVSREFKAPREHTLRAANGGVAAYTLEQRSGKWELVPQWLSRDIDMAEHAIVANGVLFVYGSGEDTTQVMPEARIPTRAARSWVGAVSNGAAAAGRPKGVTTRSTPSTGQGALNSGNEITT